MKTSERKTVIITGCNHGLGEALVTNLIDKTDHFIISVSRGVTSEQRSFSNQRFQYFQCDFENDNIEESIQNLSSFFATNQIVFVNNAGTIKPITLIETLNNKSIESSISVNMKAPILISIYLSRLINQYSLSIINITTGAAKRPISSWSLYCSTKAATHHFFEVLKEEYPTVHVRHHDPGVLDTSMQTYIRESNFSLSSVFRTYKEEGKLKSTSSAAEEIIRLI